MELLMLTLFLAISLPAWGLTLGKEIVCGRALRRKEEEEAKEIERAREELTPTEEEIAEVEALFPDLSGCKRNSPEFQRNINDLWLNLLTEHGLDADMRAIYGDRWPSKAKIAQDKSPSGKGYTWFLDGISNSPGHDFIIIRYRPEEALKALVYSHMGRVPPYNGINAPGKNIPHVNVVPYGNSINGEAGDAWYKRIEENLRNAGRDVTFWFMADDPSYYECGAFCVKVPGSEQRW